MTVRMLRLSAVVLAAATLLSCGGVDHPETITPYGAKARIKKTLENANNDLSEDHFRRVKGLVITSAGIISPVFPENDAKETDVFGTWLRNSRKSNTSGNSILWKASAFKGSWTKDSGGNWTCSASDDTGITFPYGSGTAYISLAAGGDESKVLIRNFHDFEHVASLPKELNVALGINGNDLLKISGTSTVSRAFYGSMDPEKDSFSTHITVESGEYLFNIEEYSSTPAGGIFCKANAKKGKKWLSGLLLASIGTETAEQILGEELPFERNKGAISIVIYPDLYFNGTISDIDMFFQNLREGNMLTESEAQKRADNLNKVMNVRLFLDGKDADAFLNFIPIRASEPNRPENWTLTQRIVFSDGSSLNGKNVSSGIAQFRLDLLGALGLD